MKPILDQVVKQYEQAELWWECVTAEVESSQLLANGGRHVFLCIQLSCLS